MESTVSAPWMTTPATRAVVEALTADGADVRFVGGCVRDALLGRESDDIDIGTPDPPERVLALLENAGIQTRTVPRGIEHGTVTALAGGERYEITTLRRDERTDGRHAEVAFTDDWREDAARRDFTINAMSATPDGALFDYFGGQEDLAAGRVRFVGDPATRIAEDHLRILRFFRFHAWYGRDEPDETALAACKDAAHTIPSLSAERVQAEMLKLLAARDPLPAVTAMQEVRVLAVLLPEAQETTHLARLIQVDKTVGGPDSIRRLAALIAGSDGVSAVAERWRLAGEDGMRLSTLVELLESLTTEIDDLALRRLIYRLGKTQPGDVALFGFVAERNEGDEAWRRVLETLEAWKPPTLPVSGADVLALNIPEGPEVGRLLSAVEEWWIERDFAPDRAALLEKLDALVAESRRA